MVARDLLRELEGRGVQLSIDGGRLVARGPTGAITSELADQIKAQKITLLRELQMNAGNLDPLPEALVRLVRAAAGKHLNTTGFLASGIVPNLGDYVLTCAALYACGCDPARQLKDLWAARNAWQN